MTKIIQQLNQQRDKKNDLRKLISLYVREGLVARFSQSDLGQKYILKGASVFQILAGTAHRTTKDIDFLGYGSSDEASLAKEFGEIIDIRIDDGLEFNAIATIFFYLTINLTFKIRHRRHSTPPLNLCETLSFHYQS